MKLKGMMVKMKKSDLNSSMLFKMRGNGLCALLDRHDNNVKVFYNKGNIVCGSIAGQTSIVDYNDDISLIDNQYEHDTEYDIVAIKQYGSCTNVLRKVVNNEEPEEWDWVEEVEKAEELEVGNTVQNITINITIDSKMNINDFVKELSSKIKNINNY